MPTLKDIQTFFHMPTMSEEGIRVWLWCLGLSCIFLLIAFIVKFIFSLRERRYYSGHVLDEKAIRNILNSAFDQRSNFEVQVQTAPGHRRPTLRCSPEYLGPSSISLEINGLRSLSNTWLGRDITVFFSVKVNKDTVFYTFASTVDGIRQPSQGICHIILPMPGSLENKQKRAFLRISPPPEHFLGGALWHNKSMPSPEKFNEIALWPLPELLSLSGRLVQFQVADISAGGVRISVPNSVVAERDLQFFTVEQSILMIDLNDPEQNQRLRFWLHCRVQNVWVDHSARLLNIGMQYMAWARPRKNPSTQESGTIEWLRIAASSEVEPLSNWIMRRHLEIFREHPGLA
ncbi:MAG: hypothetical protein LBN33_00570 [Desulfovibrio sp.]|jgi:hypothetical protein|nr:hypothetical protein [Desulfovibrio sp.]